jgi:AraC family transcriptional regulator, regulatory protein of adaptative response / methylated-DNA-[protein]-cysteine methyltransferase
MIRTATMHSTSGLQASQNRAPAFATDAARWAAVRTRNARAEGAFVYAVRTTGVYCRPACASRLPRRANAEFFATTAQAERAGYRPCKRCRPDGVEPRAELAQRVCAYLDARLAERVTLRALAAHVHVSPFHLQRVFKRTLGITPLQYQSARRAEHLKLALERGGTVTAAMHDAGIASSSRLYADAAPRLGMTPAVYRRRGAGLRIEYTSIETRLGVVLIAATERGVCKVALGDDRARLEAELRAEFSAALIVRTAARRHPHAARIAQYLRGQRNAPDLPLDVQATAFQLRVWRALTAIPAGETRSYAEIARAIGHPRAARAVGNACAANPVALAIPCHRALPATGRVGRFAWGSERKRALLELESAARG